MKLHRCAAAAAVLILLTVCPGSAESVDQVVAMLNARESGSHYESRYVHVEPAAAFPGCQVVSSFAFDRGYRPIYVLIKHQLVDIHKAGPAVLRTSDWQRAGRPRREQLALALLHDVVYHDEEMVQQPVQFGAERLTAPATRSLPSGGVQVDWWMYLTGGRSSARRAVHRQATVNGVESVAVRDVKTLTQQR